MRKLLLLLLLLISSVCYGQTYTMETSYSCGPDALAFAAELTRTEVKRAMHWHNHNNVLDNLHDTPSHHFIALRNLGINYSKVSASDIIFGVAVPNKTVILLHNQSRPVLIQHWAVLAAVDSTFVYLHWGDGVIHQFTHEHFTQMYTKGWPPCAYVINTPASSPLKWWERLGWNVLKNF